MKFLQKSKDGGPDSTVTAYWLVEIKGLFSIALLRFDDWTREVYHDHAFHAISWLLSGQIDESFLHNSAGEPDPCWETRHRPSIRPIVTTRSTFHQVRSKGTSWALTFRGPWAKTWHEYDLHADEQTTLTHGRRVVR
jgi:hypothetical protein